MSSPHIGILVCERDSDRQVGIVEFHPSGVLGFQIIQAGLHVYALKPVERVLTSVYPKPLYVKYARLLERKGKLGIGILRREARNGAVALNRSRPTLKVGHTRVSARMVQYRD